MKETRKLVLECTYIADDVAHTKFYVEGEEKKAGDEFRLIHSKHPEYPIRMYGAYKNILVDVRKGPEYDFNNLALTVDVKTETGSVITYLARKVKFGQFSVVMTSRTGKEFTRGCTVVCNTRRTEEQLMNQRNEGNFDRHRFIEDVLA